MARLLFSVYVAETGNWYVLTGKMNKKLKQCLTNPRYAGEDGGVAKTALLTGGSPHPASRKMLI